MGLCPSQFEQWIGACDMAHITMTLSDEALMAAYGHVGGKIELRPQPNLVDPRLRALATAVDLERTAGFPSGRLFLDSIEQALARALVVGNAVSARATQVHRGGLSPRRLRKVKEFVDSRMEEDFSLREMAGSVQLSPAHFSRMFREATGESPHRF